METLHVFRSRVLQNGTSCKFAHGNGGFGEEIGMGSSSPTAVTGSPTGKIDAFEDLRRIKTIQQQQQRIAAMAGGGVPPFPFNRCMNFLNENPRFSVDGTPIREFQNAELIGVPFPKNQPMRIHSSLWNADDWATRGGLVKTDWSKASFTASYRNFRADACVMSSGKSSCGESGSSGGDHAWLSEELDNTKQEKLR